jgi:hypothetical protein
VQVSAIGSGTAEDCLQAVAVRVEHHVRDTNARMIDHDGNPAPVQMVSHENFLAGSHFLPAVRVSDVWVAVTTTMNLIAGVIE